MAQFIDQVHIFLKAGNGGNGSMSIKREKFKPFAGPDGGKGGNGGSIIFKSDYNLSSLIELKYHPHITALDGEMGYGKNKDGISGQDQIVKVPIGTIIKDMDGNTIFDFLYNNQEFVAAKGGIGGFGNFRLQSKERKAPGFRLLGTPGEELELQLELKLVANVALVGYPSTGKSSLINALSNSKAKVADYEFTTITPNLGVVKIDNTNSYTIADVPGIIEGAAEGKGLGHKFLKHIERASVLVHIIDPIAYDSSRTPLDDYHAIERELDNYDYDFSKVPRVIVINKIDVQDGLEYAKMVTPEFEALGLPVFQVSAASRIGLEQLKFKLNDLVLSAPKTEDNEDDFVTITPKFTDQKPYIITETKAGNYRVRGDKINLWLYQTDFTNPEAVGYLADRLKNVGIENELIKLGATEETDVILGEGEGEMTFNLTLEKYESYAGSPLGSDRRLDPYTRRTTKDRLDRGEVNTFE
jgi:GTP-binding protein